MGSVGGSVGASVGGSVKGSVSEIVGSSVGIVSLGALSAQLQRRIAHTRNTVRISLFILDHP